MRNICHPNKDTLQGNEGSKGMEWQPGGANDDIEDRRGDSGGGFGFGGGGGLGIVGVVVLLVISLLTGRNYIGSYLSGGGATQQAAPQQSGQVQESPAERRSAELISVVLRDTQNVWTQILPEQTGKQYRHAHLVLFRDETYSNCGTAQASTGPFYCPADEKVYIDLSFWDELKRLGGDSGDFAQAYVVAHELGHHIQKILGTEETVGRAMEQNRSQRNELSVKLELQADCYAGVWANHTKLGIDNKDVEGALKAASAVGDDHLQQMSGQAVSPESFTHGTSAQRIAWFKRGMQTGQVSSCDTFGAASSEQ